MISLSYREYTWVSQWDIELNMRTEIPYLTVTEMYPGFQIMGSSGPLLEKFGGPLQRFGGPANL